MLIKGSSVIGSKVITVKEGREVEDVDDIIYDPLDNRVKALLVDSGGLFTDATVILLEETQSIGENTVLIDSERALKHASDVSPSVSNIAKGNTYLTQKRIVTEDGRQLGVITDIYFDPKTGKVEEFEVSQGLEDVRSGKKRIKISDVVTVGQDATIVREYAVEEFQKQSQTQGISGAVSRGVDKVSEETPQLVDQSRAKLDEWGEGIKQMTASTLDQVEEMVEKAKDVYSRPSTQEAIQKAEDKTRKAFGSVQEQIQEIKQRAQTKTREIGDQAKDQLKEDAVGKYVTKNILSPSDKILIRRGEIVTYRVVNEAEKDGILDQILRNLSTDPVKRK